MFVCVQKRPMQTDGWPELDEAKQPDMTEQDLLQAKSVILTWIKDLRAQPEVRSSNIPLTLPAHLTLFTQHTFYPHLAAKCVAWRTSGEGPGGPAVSLALGPRSQSDVRYGAGVLDFNGAAPR